MAKRCEQLVRKPGGYLEQKRSQCLSAATVERDGKCYCRGCEWQIRQGELPARQRSRLRREREWQEHLAEIKAAEQEGA